VARELEVAASAVEEAAAHLRANLGRLTVGDKAGVNGQREVVTNLDLELSALITDRLRAAFPSDTVLSEEAPIAPAASPPRYWIIDPIDGTRSIVDGRAGAAIVVTLIEAGMPTVMAVHDIAGQRTISMDSAGIYLDRRPKKFAPATNPALLWNPALHHPLRDQIVAHFALDHVVEIESTALRAFALYEGKACAFISLPGSSKIWDSAPAIPLIAACGGAYTDFTGAPIALDTHHLVNSAGAVASRDLPHRALLGLLARSFP
jgi:fructose-1,6-bisphosphatase/inositol monophosphatase family enzyme